MIFLYVTGAAAVLLLWIRMRRMPDVTDLLRCVVDQAPPDWRLWCGQVMLSAPIQRRLLHPILHHHHRHRFQDPDHRVGR